MALGNAESIAVIVVLLGNIGVWAKSAYDAKKNGRSSGGGPCSFHSQIEGRVSKVETERVGLANELVTLHFENREEHHQIFSEIKSLAVSVSAASEAARTAAAAAATAATAAAASRRVERQ